MDFIELNTPARVSTPRYLISNLSKVPFILSRILVFLSVHKLITLFGGNKPDAHKRRNGQV